MERLKREDYRAAIVATLLYNANRNPKKGQAARPETFFPSLKRQPEDGGGD